MLVENNISGMDNAVLNWVPNAVCVGGGVADEVANLGFWVEAFEALLLL